MREKWARRIAYLTGILVLLLTVYFAHIQNPSTGLESSETEVNNQTITQKSSDDIVFDIEHQERIIHGKKIYQQQACAMCHAIEGQGNPRYPLDDAATKRTEAELLDWITGNENIKDQISERILVLKNSNSKLSEHEIESLIIYLQSTRPPK